MEPLATGIKETCKNLSLSEPTVYRLLKAGKLRKVKVGRKTLITMESQRALLGIS